jgi:hypothetical protein
MRIMASGVDVQQPRRERPCCPKAAATAVADVNHQPTTSAQEAGRVVAERSAEAAGFKRLKNSRPMRNL